MKTIRNLAIQWFNDKDTYNKSELSNQYYKETISYNFTALTGREIENIFYNEVVLKWADTPEYFEALNWMNEKQIKEIYLKEHTKEEQVETSLPKKEWGVHISHCCKKHGCKYSDERCPVVLGLISQKYKCEFGDFEDPCFPEQPKEEVDVWDEMINKLNDLTFKNITSENPLLKEDYSKWIFEQMKQHYILTKK